MEEERQREEGGRDGKGKGRKEGGMEKAKGGRREGVTWRGRKRRVGRTEAHLFNLDIFRVSLGFNQLHLISKLGGKMTCEV